MADLVSNKKSQRRLGGRESSDNNNKSIDLDSFETNNQQKEAAINNSKNKSSSSNSDHLAANNSGRTERNAKSKAKQAITNLSSSCNSSKAKIDSTNSFSSEEASTSTTVFTHTVASEGTSRRGKSSSRTSNKDNEISGRSSGIGSGSGGVKRSRSHSSTGSITSTSASTNTNKRLNKTAESTTTGSQRSSGAGLRSLRNSTDTHVSSNNSINSETTTNRQSNKSKYTETPHSSNSALSSSAAAVPSKKPKYSSNTKANLNESSSSSSSNQSKPSGSQSTNQREPTPTLIQTSNNKELGNTCTSRPKETGNCITKSALRRRSQQGTDTAQTPNTTLSSNTATATATQSNTFASTATTTAAIGNKKSKYTKNRKSSTDTRQQQQQQQQQATTRTNMNSQQSQSSQDDATATTGQGTPTTTTVSATTASTTTAAAAVPNTSTLNAYTFPISESESDTDGNSDFSRLTDILQARGLPTHIVNAFGTKVQQFLSRTISNGLPSRAQQLIQTLQQPDESLKLTALSEMCQLLVMGNEDTLIGFPIKQAVPLLLQCMNTDTENYDLMNHACRALTYMMESLPRSSSIIAEGIPILLEKLQIIQCIDVAEQALTALEILSRRNSKQILHSNGISACLTFIDFFSIGAQRNALQITANCCQNMIKEEFIHIQSSLPILSQRIQHSDKRLVESVCTIFSRLVENFQHNCDILKEIASHSVLTNMQQILIVQPQIISSSIFVLVLHTMYLMCINCTELAVDLLHNNIADTLRFLLIGGSSSSSQQQQQKTSQDVKSGGGDAIELISRPPQELYEIVSLICEIMPKLPNTGIFSIDDILKKSSSSHQQEHVQWQWKDEREIWRPYTQIDSRLIEASYRQDEDDEITLTTMGRTYVVDFNSMLQINEETGTARPVIRKILPSQSPIAVAAPATTTTATTPVDIVTVTKTEEDSASKQRVDCRLEFLNKNSKPHDDYVRSLFGILYEVYSSTAGPAIKHRCLRALLRMIYYTNETLVCEVLRNLTISSHIASMLASQDLKIICTALQMSEILMHKLPNIFSIYFHREGVIHQIDRIIENAATATTMTTQIDIASIVKHTQQPSTSDTSTTATPATPAAAVVVKSTPFSMESLLATGSSGANNNNTDQVDNVKIVESSLKRKVRAPKRAGRNKSNKNEDNTPNVQQQPQEEHQQPSTPSKYMHNLMAQISGAASFTNRFQQSSSATSTSKIPIPSSTTTTTTPAVTALTGATSPASASQSSSYPLFASNLWWGLKNPPSSSVSTNNSNNAALLQNTKSTYKYVPTTIPLTGGAAGAAATVVSNQQRRKLATNPSVGITPTTTGVPMQSQYNPLTEYNTINFNKEKVKQWILDQAKHFKHTYFSDDDGSQTASTAGDVAKSCDHPGLVILKRLNTAVEKLLIDENSLDSLRDISDIIYETDISSFEMIHSGLITKLLDFLTHDNGTKFIRLKQFLHVFVQLPLCTKNVDLKLEDDDHAATVDLKHHHASNTNSSNASKNLLQNLILKLHNCVNQLEQYAVRVHDVPNTIGYGKSAIKFFNTHQLKCLLQRTPDSTTIRAWKGGPVKVDPLAIVSAIEKYLIMRGINKAPTVSSSSASSHRHRQHSATAAATTTITTTNDTENSDEDDEEDEDEEDEDEDDDDDIEDALSTILGRNIDSHGPQLELLINGNVLPSNMTIYQAIRQFALHADTDNENDNESFMNNEIWSKVHKIDYRIASSNTATATITTTTPSTATSTSDQRTLRNFVQKSSQSKSQKSSVPSTSTAAAATTAATTTEQFNCESNSKLFYEALNNKWLKNQTIINDASLNAISLIRILKLLNRNWHLLYTSDTEAPLANLQLDTFIINPNEFVNTKLTAKANRQLQDPLVIMTGHLPKWLPELIRSCSFLFPFETRLMFFYASSFDRDRAMQKLLDTNTDLNTNLNDSHSNTNERIVPKLERKKKTIIRSDDLFKQTEAILNEFTKSKALLEIQYENEVGTGLGPTLEYYALTSLEVQKCDHELWRGDKIKMSTAKGVNQNCLFFSSPQGLFPAPLAKNSKQQLVTKVKQKFKTFGRFVAKAIMDFRVIDVQLSLVFYKWIIDHTKLCENDIKYIDMSLYRSIQSLREYLSKYKTLTGKQVKLTKTLKHADVDVATIKSDLKLIDTEISKLNLTVKELYLDFTLPGYGYVELKKGGKDVGVCLNNLEEYIRSVVHWTLIEGVQRQFDAFIEGFNSIFPIKSLQLFYPEELERLCCGSGYDIWDSKLLIECTRCDHGYTHDSKAVQYLFEIMCSFSPDEQRLFLQFVTGSPRLPVGGLRSLAPQLTIVRKTVEGNEGPDNYLPSVMTCVNYLKLPEYSNIDIMRKKIAVAMTDGQLSFNLS